MSYSFQVNIYVILTKNIYKYIYRHTHIWKGFQEHTEKSLSKGQRNDNKLVDGLAPLLLETAPFSRENFVGNLLVSASDSLEFTRNLLLLRETQFPVVKNLRENGEHLRVEGRFEA